MHRWYNVKDSDKVIAYNQIYEQMGLPAFAAEKDWWVVQTLAILFEHKIGEHLVFKGGTSLSKAWSLIERFSEDIDLAVDRTFYGFEGELGKGKRDKLRKTAKTYVTETLFPDLKNAFNSKGLTGVNLELSEIKSSDQDPVIINVNYPNVIPSPGYIQPRVQIEIGCRSLHEPYENRPIVSLVDAQYPKAPFAQQPVTIPTVLVERTFLEKIFLLHEEYQRPKEKSRVSRLSRHLYDIYQIAKTGYANKALQDRELYETIVKHRNSLTRLSGVDYNLHNPQSINLLPSEEVLSEWKKDYKTMQEQMIYGDSPAFQTLISSLKEFNENINSLEWKMESSF